MTLRSYDDAISTWVETRDCGILGRYYATPNGTTLTIDQRSAIEGKPNSYCNEWIGSFIQPQVPTIPNNCGSGFPASIVYDPRTRRVGVRCAIHDMLINILGTAVDGDGNARPKLPYDNTGVQYGLAALRAGSITAEQFVQLNEGVGSYDADMNWSGGLTATPTIPRSLPRASGNLPADLRQRHPLERRQPCERVDHRSAADPRARHPHAVAQRAETRAVRCREWRSPEPHHSRVGDLAARRCLDAAGLPAVGSLVDRHRGRQSQRNARAKGHPPQAGGCQGWMLHQGRCDYDRSGD